MTTDYHEISTIDTPMARRQTMGIGDLWINGAVCHVCAQFIRSKNRHDYVTCTCGNISIDGGSWYARGVGGEDGFTSVLVPYREIDEDAES